MFCVRLWADNKPAIEDMKAAGAPLLYRRFGVSSQENIRQDPCRAVLDFLEEWQESVVEKGEAV